MNTYIASSAALCISLIFNPALAQIVYKCTEGGTVVFSQSPCSQTAETVDMGRTNNVSASQRPQAVTDMMRDAQTRTIQLAYERCLRIADQDVMGLANRRIGDMSSRVQYLQAFVRPREGDSLADTTYKAGLRTEIASLQTSMYTERAAADQLLRERYAQCDAQQQRAIETAQNSPQ